MNLKAFPILLLLAGTFGGSSCQSGESNTSELPPATEGRTPAASTSAGPSPGKLIFSDDFSNPDSGWERNRDEDYIADYSEGEYQIKNAVDHQITRGMFERREVSDGDFSVTVRKISGPDDFRFGLVTRYTGEDFLEASIMPDGRCALWMAHYGQYVLKTRPVFKPCPAVRRGNEPNHLRVIVSGARATFYINGENAAEIDTISQGGRGFGLFANSTSTGSDVRFDNFELHETR